MDDTDEKWDEVATAWSEFLVAELEWEREVHGDALGSLDAELVEAFGQAMVAVTHMRLRKYPDWFVMPDGTEDRTWYRTFMGIHPLGPYDAVLRKEPGLSESDAEFDVFVTLRERVYRAHLFNEAGAITHEEFHNYVGDYIEDWREFKAKLG